MMNSFIPVTIWTLLFNEYNVDGILVVSDNVISVMNPYQRCLQTKVPNLNEQKQVNLKSYQVLES